MEKRVLDRRLEQMRGRGHRVPGQRERRRERPGRRAAARLRRDRARRRRDRVARPADPRAASSPASTRRWSSSRPRTGCRRATSPSTRSPATGKHVVIIGGGDTGADCLGTVHRHGCASVHQFEILPRPPDDAARREPVADLAAHLPHRERARGGRRAGLRGEHRVLPRRRRRQRPGAARRTRSSRSSSTAAWCSRRSRARDFELPCDLALLAMGFVGPQRDGLLEQLGVDFTDRGNVARDERWATNVDGVFVCGDMGRGQSLIVWAIAEGRSCAAAVDRVADGRDRPARRRSRPTPRRWRLARPRRSPRSGRGRDAAARADRAAAEPLGAAATRSRRTSARSAASAPTSSPARCSRRTGPGCSRCGSGLDGPVAWWSPDPRGVIPLDGMYVSRSLRRSQRRFELRVNTAFEAVMRACADPRRPARVDRRVVRRRVLRAAPARLGAQRRDLARRRARRRPLRRRDRRALRRGVDVPPRHRRVEGRVAEHRRAARRRRRDALRRAVGHAAPRVARRASRCRAREYVRRCSRRRSRCPGPAWPDPAS